MDYQMGKICRICLKEGDDLTSIFYNDNASDIYVSLSNKIMACSSVQVMAGDGLPEMICNKCLSQVDIAYEFREKSQSADAALRKYISLIRPAYESTVQYDNQLKVIEEPALLFPEEDEFDVKYNLNVFEFDKVVSLPKVSNSNIAPELSKNSNDNPFENLNVNSLKKNKKGKVPVKKSKKLRTCKSSSGDEVGCASDSDKKKSGKNDQDVKCPICKKCFAYLCILKDHMVQHTGAKPFLCSACGKSFGRTTSLSNHMKIHYSDKPHKCDRCELSFHRRAHLVLHMRTHTGEKPFVCEVCGRNFAQSSYLKEHMRLHSGEKPFVCDICGRRFARKSCLVMHRRVHTGELPYACPECGRAFSQRSQRKRHIKRKHIGSACLRATGELILKDLDSRNKVSAQEEMLNENPTASENSSFVQSNMNLQQPTGADPNFRDMTIFQQEPPSPMSSANIPIPLMQIHRTLLQ